MFVPIHRNPMEVGWASNPWNDNKIFHYVKETDKPGAVVTIRHRCNENEQQEFWRILDEECEAASLLERQELCTRMGSIKCPHFDRNKKPLISYLARWVLHPVFTGELLGAMIFKTARMPGWSLKKTKLCRSVFKVMCCFTPDRP